MPGKCNCTGQHKMYKVRYMSLSCSATKRLLGFEKSSILGRAPAAKLMGRITRCTLAMISAMNASLAGPALLLLLSSISWRPIQLEVVKFLSPVSIVYVARLASFFPHSISEPSPSPLVALCLIDNDVFLPSTPHKSGLPSAT